MGVRLPVFIGMDFSCCVSKNCTSINLLYEVKKNPYIYKETTPTISSSNTPPLKILLQRIYKKQIISPIALFPAEPGRSPHT